MSQHTFKLDLYQVARVHTESFTVEAGDEKQAKIMAEEIAKSKGLTKDYDFEISDISAAASAGGVEAATVPPEPEER